MGENERNYKIGVVILNYATYSDTIELVAQLQSQTIADQIMILVVDNSSPNESYEMLKPLEQRFENTVVITTERNEGYARGNNFGLEYLDEHVKPEYVTILNNDVILPHDCFERLIERYQVLERPALIAPVMVYPDGRRVIYNKINTFKQDLASMFYLLRVLRLGGNVPAKEIDNTGSSAMSVEVISGSFMFVNLAVFKHMGFFYPNTFLYGEERFVASAAKKLSYRNYILLDQSYIHNHAVTISAYHNVVSKYGMLYDSLLKFTKEYREYGRFKAAILRVAMGWSLFELRVIGLLKK